MMEKYLNKSGNSGVHSYEIGSDYILVEYTIGSIYEYTYTSTGKINVEKMKIYALSGNGLHSFIQRTVGLNFARKIR